MLSNCSSRLVVCAPCARCVADMVHGHNGVEAMGLAPLDAPLAAIQTRPLPHQGEKGLITVITVREKSGQNGRPSSVLGKEKWKEATAGRTRPFRNCGFYTCSSPHRDLGAKSGADPHRTPLLSHSDRRSSSVHMVAQPCESALLVEQRTSKAM